VTEFVFELYPLDPRVLSVDCFYSADDGEQVLRAFREIALDAPEETTVAAWVGTAGPWPFLPNELHGQTLVNLSFIHVGDPSAASGVADALRGAAPVIHESQEQMTFGELQSASDEAMAHGKRRYWKSHYLTELTDAAIGAFLSRGGPASSDGIVANASLEARGGAQARIGPDATAFANRDARFSWITMAAWDDPAEDGPRMGAARRLADAMAPHASGVYVNALADPGDATGLSAAYRPGHLARLARLKARFGPDNAFHPHQNIAPQAG
jgi:hypothetical protein